MTRIYLYISSKKQGPYMYMKKKGFITDYC